MVLETESTEAPDASELPSLETEETPPEEARETPESATEEPENEAPEEGTVWDPSRWKDDEEFQRWQDFEGRKREIAGQKRASGRIAEAMGLAQHANQQLGSIVQILKTAQENGESIGETLGNALAQNPEALKAYHAIQGFQAQEGIVDREVQTVFGALSLLSQAAGLPDLAKTYGPQLADEVRFAEDRGAATFMYAVKDALKAARDEGYKRGLNAGKGVGAEVQKGEDRKGQAPANVQGKAGGRPIDPDTIPTNEWIQKPIEEREKIKARWAQYVSR